MGARSAADMRLAGRGTNNGQTVHNGGARLI
jgi:hypothetical protein